MNVSEGRKNIVVGVTGASGAAYAKRLVQCLCDANVRVHLVVSDYGKRLLSDELDIGEISAKTLVGHEYHDLQVYSNRDVGAVLASGSFITDGMVVCPCTSHTLAAMATGLGESLLHRAAAVTLKEMRRLVVVLREMPMSRADMLNALRLSEAGAVICPAAPGFYMRPQTVDDLVDFVVGKILDLLSVEHGLHTRWSDQLASDRRDRKGTV